jgi:hypothetical protein
MGKGKLGEKCEGGSVEAESRAVTCALKRWCCAAPPARLPLQRQPDRENINNAVHAKRRAKKRHHFAGGIGVCIASQLQALQLFLERVHLGGSMRPALLFRSIDLLVARNLHL